ncbi:Lrp/AsnC family transcriptional regulator [Natronobacterium gregoryi]|uniref:Transcription regulator, AsnC-type n=2 Tax=Natronobacterium gregoryi TaxID=44930 RepID=L0AK47_NATGS|nr:Lrp/AsnC ligand binding domain-containing protein [Natronobacterium gregoryi]AFZ73829.1 transcriptional regulator [Natronobacterium gregoryi SP2]ELY65076.1 transcription regulator, AsnC-type [Natronobacterium gregoryi SP2]PLK19713.1 transcriptional regulator [Natronobacterium gregoryi SP2]SFJ42069.1 transcriptional regulator, AsnC family [Natronobacterium gregoryi]
MVTAFVMVKANTGEADRLRSEITALEGVESAHIVAGDVDIIAKVGVETPAAVKETAATRIQGIDGVEGTQTYIAMD